MPIGGTVYFELIAKDSMNGSGAGLGGIKTMAMIQNDLIIQGLSGKVGRQLAVHRKRDGKYKVCAAQLDNHQPIHIEAQDEHHRRLYEALLYSEATPQISSNGASELSPNPIGESVSVVDVIHPPEIHRIDVSKYTGRAGELISITAGDDVKVASVGVLIVNGEGILVEKGSAILSDLNPYAWMYTTTTTASSRFVRIVVDVADVAPLDDEATAVTRI
jgi:hypothetical protein